jgi:tRNA-uridine 2-sulfurtransferase
MPDKKKIKVAVGVSGGVDSSVAVALLREQGYDVIGVFMHFWHESVKGKVRDNICCSLESSEDARRVCQKLDIPFYTMNMKVQFKKNVVDDFIDEYSKGRTPNPCVRCNRYVKFGEFIKKAKALGVDYVATGHYAKVKEKKDGLVHLYMGKDKAKDQSYFLHQLTQTQLKSILFPLGDLNKDKVRRLAKKFGLATASKKESQEICFIPDSDVAGFLSRKTKFETGEIKDFQTKEVLGKHDGLPRYTIGQRKGIGLAGGPWFVVRLDMKKNILWVSRDEKDLLSKNLIVKNVNWMAGEPKFPMKVKCRIRYRSKEVNAIINKKDSRIEVEFSRPERAVTAGQYAVFWKGKECLGGGVIE